MEEDHAALRRIDFALAEHGETSAKWRGRLSPTSPATAIARPLGLQIAHLAGQRIVLDHRRRRWRHHVNLRSVAVLNDDDEAGLRLLPVPRPGVCPTAHRKVRKVRHAQP
jgi:hypothetical protein